LLAKVIEQKRARLTLAFSFILNRKPEHSRHELVID